MLLVRLPRLPPGLAPRATELGAHPLAVPAPLGLEGRPAEGFPRLETPPGRHRCPGRWPPARPLGHR